MTDSVSYKCIVLAPFNSDFLPIFSALSDALRRFNIRCTWLGAVVDFSRSSVQARRSMTETVNQHITDADLVIADITGSSPNVMYELGIAHALGKAVLLIGRREGLTKDEQIFPFDLRGFLVFWYDPLSVQQLTEYVSIWAANTLGPSSQALAGD